MKAEEINVELDDIDKAMSRYKDELDTYVEEEKKAAEKVVKLQMKIITALSRAFELETALNEIEEGKRKNE